jgi:hypothetical protein
MWRGNISVVLLQIALNQYVLTTPSWLISGHMSGSQFRQRCMWHQCVEKRGPVGALCIEYARKHSVVGTQFLEEVPVGWKTHARSDTHLGGKF